MTRRTHLFCMTSFFFLSVASTWTVAAENDLAADAASALKRAAQFYRTKVALRGGYVYYYSVDLQRRLGEGVAGPDQIWVQPPGTPTVGMAYLAAYDATGDPFYLQAATDAAEALIYGQLKSGGWTNRIDFNPRSDGVADYRNGRGRGKDNSTLDDGITQGAIQLLVRADRAHDWKHEAIHEAAGIALDALLQAQFPNGGFPQVWTEPVSKQPIVRANFPDYDWRTEGRIKNYWDMYTLNDGLAGTVSDALIDAHQVYGDEKYKTALARLGDFLILAQMPDPQPAWAQQYNYDMQPIWARRFEPPAVTGGESQDAIATLLKIFHYTGDEKYLQPIPAAVDYLRRSLLDDGRLARYYELKTNEPLYMQRRGKEYSLTHDDSNLPSHYGWKIASRLDQLQRDFDAARTGAKPGPPTTPAESQVRAIIDQLDDAGRWITTFHGEPLTGQPKFREGDRYISSAVFSHNVETLARYVADSRR